MKDPELRWNIFARELQDILRKQNEELSIIDNRVPIHREKIRRLQKSLASPKRFPLLNPEDLAMLIEKFKLTEDDVIRLRAAILATSVEATLMGRIRPQDALRAAEQVFEITVKSLRSNDGGLNAVVRGGEGYSAIQEASAGEGSDASVDLEPALTAMDWGALSIHLAGESNSYAQRLAYLEQARAAFDYALQKIEEVEDGETAAMWREEAERGRDRAKTELDDLDA